MTDTNTTSNDFQEPDGEDVTNADNAIAIGEDAFLAGFKAGVAYATVAGGAELHYPHLSVEAAHKAWSEYDPPEDIKALT